MSDLPKPAAPVPLERAWRELGRARWGSSRELFSAALAAEETPEAYEGLSWAAWWQDDADTVFEARERAYRGYERRGDTAGAARLATWLAVDELDFRGAAAIAKGWLARARRLLAGHLPSAEHGWLAFQEGYLAHASGDTGRAMQHAQHAAALGRSTGVADLEMLGLALEGASRVARAEVEAGMACLDEATAVALARDAAIPISGAWTCCFLVSACTQVLDFERASGWCDRIAEFAERYGSRYMLAFCRAEYGAVELWRGRWEEAEELLECSVEDFTHSRPAWVGGPLVGLAELRRRQGRRGDAARLLREAGVSSAEQLCRARLALDRGQGRSAVELLERLLRQQPADRRLSHAPALELLVLARVARGHLPAAAAALEQLRAAERMVGTPALRACADRAEGVLRAARGEPDRARELLEDALDRFRKGGATYEAARARLELAEALIALGRLSAARREAEAAERALRGLGAGPDAERARGLAECCGEGGRVEAALGQLTPREREVLALLAEGLTNQGIAERLVVSEHTVHRHVSNVLRKLGMPSRAAAVAHAVRHELVDG